MAEMASYLAVDPITITANATLVRGVRVSLNSSGTCDVADATTAGDYVTLTAIEAAKPGTAVNTAGGGKVPALASEAVAVGDAAYAAAAGKFSKTTTNATLLGRWTLAASGDGVLGEVLLGV
jgi:hypothetical protein